MISYNSCTNLIESYKVQQDLVGLTVGCQLRRNFGSDPGNKYDKTKDILVVMRDINNHPISKKKSTLPVSLVIRLFLVFF